MSPAGELLAVPQLSAEELEGVARLEAACLGADGGRLKLEWPSVRQRPGDATSDFIWLVGDEIAGYVGIHQWRPIQLEFVGMVHPSRRRQGIGAALYDAAAGEIARRGPASALLIVDRRLEASARFCLERGGELDHSEHRMHQRREPDRLDGSAAAVTVRSARPSDAAFVGECLARAFGEELSRLEPDDPESVDREIRGTIVIEVTGEPVGVMRVERDGGVASIYGFAVLPELQGRGYGRAALSTVTRDLHVSGVGTISLEVLSTNDSALHLYNTCGFDSMGTEDYYSMPIV